MGSCKICNFNNPKGTATAVIIQTNKVLLLKRSEKPFKGKWDFPGGYMNATENPEQCVMREVKEELNVDCIPAPFTTVNGYGIWKNKKFPIISHVYLCEINEPIRLNAENSEYAWFDLKDLNPKKIAFDSNRLLAIRIKDQFTIDLERVSYLMRQLDPDAVVKEQNLYKAMIEGHVVQMLFEGELIGLGSIFIRQTMLRKQAVIEDMIINENYRGKGYGKALLQSLIIWARNENVEVVELTTNSKRIAAHALYENFGFKLHLTDHMLLKL